jgi:16S rRNA C1402 (ribose-2'-O) methylase RsmI
MGNRMIAVCKEITKIHEEFIRGSVKDVISHFHNSKEIIKGEYVIVVSIDLPEDQPFINRVLSVKKSKLVKNAVNKIKN